jgi:hypothetical protein
LHANLWHPPQDGLRHLEQPRDCGCSIAARAVSLFPSAKKQQQAHREQAVRKRNDFIIFLLILIG